MSEVCETPTVEKEIVTPPHGAAQAWIGVTFGFVAAVGYTAANIALRQSARPGDIDWSIWVTAHKAVPAFILTWSIVLTNHFRGAVAFPPRKLILPLICTGIAMQFGGNMMFQYSLGLIGLAMTVPICFSMILTGGAIASRFFLGEPITGRTLLALAFLMGAVTILSFGAGEASQAILTSASGGEIALGITVAMIAGTSYGVSGVVIRRNVRNLPVSATLFLISTTGLVGMTLAAVLRIPMEELLATTPRETGIMLLAGFFNAIAFYSIGFAYRHLPVNQVNMINTSQIAMASLAGVLIFMEPLTFWLISGVILTMIGLILMERRQQS